MKVLILTEGGKKVGFGHIARCIPIYDVFIQKNHQIEFIIDGDSSIYGLINGITHRLIDWNADINKIDSLIKESDLVILDSLEISNANYQKLISMSSVAVIDDLQLRDYKNNEIVIDWFLFSENNKFYKNKNAILGTKYVPLRRAFWGVKNKFINEDVHDIVISLGGTDYRNMAPKIIRMLKNEFNNLKVHLFVAKGFNNLDEIKRVNHSNLILHLEPTDETMIDICQKSDIAIATGGHTIFELARLGLPTIHFLVVENQRRSENWKLTNFTEFVGWWNDQDIISDIAKSVRKLKKKDLRKKMSLSGKNLVDGNGASNLVNELVNKLK